ncbi:F0F1 ATP synthase subunit B [Vagococcus salmoninarum]|uniref:F0F1 ATP synthase subunit B n=1 Tax=Vagococcus salmoninarum TaxID=2739 RepID=UPI0018803FD0|nr:F0F1 ATP synthase subunit B [Vagococcus salmoninarum]MBE9389471.1 F0F1 ATP synthase subunit B [Vagococcus salmoninarum]
MINNLVVGSTTTLTTMAFVSISFLLLMLLIKKFAWGPMTKMLDERAEKIANEIDGAEQAKIDATDLAKKSEVELTKAKAEAAGIIKRAKDNAEVSAENIITEAKRNAQNYREKAEKDVAIEREQIIESARREVADLSIQIAAKILKKELNQDTHAELINSYIEGLGTTHED